MKKTLFIFMLAVALMGSESAFAGTVVTGYETEHFAPMSFVAGKYGEHSSVQVGARVRVSSGSGSEGFQFLENVYGCYMSGQSETMMRNATDNRVVMTGGEVYFLTGCYLSTEKTDNPPDAILANRNMVVMSGGEVLKIKGVATTNQTGGMVMDNSIVVTGGIIGSVYICSADPSNLTLKDNSVSIMGKGTTYSYQDWPGEMKTETFVGKEIRIGKLAASEERAGSTSGNSLNISGTDIQIGEVGSDFQLLNFHLLADQLASTAPMVTITGTNGLSITKDLSLSFDAVEGMIWKPGDSVTLVEAQKGMNIAPEMLAKEYNIYQNGDPETITATAKLVLEQGQGTTQFLKLTIEQGQGDTQFLKLTDPNVPEPSTGTLSLLSLAGLCARRRK